MDALGEPEQLGEVLFLNRLLAKSPPRFVLPLRYQ